MFREKNHLRVELRGGHPQNASPAVLVNMTPFGAEGQVIQGNKMFHSSPGRLVRCLD